MRKALFRLDAGPDKGLGHFMRCRTLAVALRQMGWQSVFIGHGFGTPQLEGMAQAGDIKLVSLPIYSSCGVDATAFADFARQYAADMVVVDNYSYKQEAFRVMQQQKLRVVAIDDTADVVPEAQVVLNPGPGFSRLPYENHGVDLILCGSDYTLVRPEISCLRSRKYCSDGHILISLGGGDVANYLIGIAAELLPKTSRKIVLSVSGNYKSEKLSAWVAEHSDSCELSSDMSRFPQLLADASLAITGAGGTLWESCCLGLPWLGVIWVDNQGHAARVSEKFNLGLTVDCIDLNDDTNRGRFNAAVISAFERLLDLQAEWGQMVDAQRAFIDGNGALRAAEQITGFFDLEIGR